MKYLQLDVVSEKGTKTVQEKFSLTVILQWSVSEKGAKTVQEKISLTVILQVSSNDKGNAGCDV